MKQNIFILLKKKYALLCVHFVQDEDRSGHRNMRGTNSVLSSVGPGIVFFFWLHIYNSNRFARSSFKVSKLFMMDECVKIKKRPKAMDSPLYLKITHNPMEGETIDKGLSSEQKLSNYQWMALQLMQLEHWVGRGMLGRKPQATLT